MGAPRRLDPVRDLSWEGGAFDGELWGPIFAACGIVRNPLLSAAPCKTVAHGSATCLPGGCYHRHQLPLFPRGGGWFVSRWSMAVQAGCGLRVLPAGFQNRPALLRLPTPTPPSSFLGGGCEDVPPPGIHSKVWIDGGGKGTVRTQTVTRVFAWSAIADVHISEWRGSLRSFGPVRCGTLSVWGRWRC